MVIPQEGLEMRQAYKTQEKDKNSEVELVLFTILQVNMVTLRNLLENQIFSTP